MPELLLRSPYNLGLGPVNLTQRVLQSRSSTIVIVI